MIKFLKDRNTGESESGKTPEEQVLVQLDQKIEFLKQQYLLFFSGDIQVPPEKEREQLVKNVHKISSIESRSPRIRMLTQNLLSKFSLYNNLWLKKMSELELGLSPSQRKTKAAPSPSQVKETKDKEKALIPVSLNKESTFDDFYRSYQKFLGEKNISATSKETLVNSLKSKMVMHNLIDCRIEVTFKEGKVSLKFKR